MNTKPDKKLRNRTAAGRFVNVLQTVVLVVATMLPAGVGAAQLENRTLTLESSVAGATTGHNFSFQMATSGATVGEFKFEYCSNDPFPDEACTAPTGLDVDTVTLDAQSGVSGFTIDATNTTANVIVVDNATPQALTGTPTITFDFGNAVNPDTSNTQYFVRMYVYDSDAGTTKVDDGGLAFSTAESVDVTARVQETLTFCIYATGASCATPGTTTVDLGVLTTTAERTAAHQGQVATNALNGFAIQYTGSTLTHSNATDTIAAIGGTKAASNPGTPQFGLRITTVSGTGVTFDNDYNATDCGGGTDPCYAFVDGATISADGSSSTATNAIASATGPVDTNVFDLTFLGNIDALTPTGTYSTTVVYVATAKF